MVTNDSKVTRRRKMQTKRAMSADPLDWLNGYSNVPYTESVVWSDQKELDYNPSKTKDQFWMKRWNINPIGPNGGLVYHPHYEPFDLKEIGVRVFTLGMK